MLYGLSEKIADFLLFNKSIKLEDREIYIDKHFFY
jgi:hypothetical protein